MLEMALTWIMYKWKFALFRLTSRFNINILVHVIHTVIQSLNFKL